MIPTQLSLPSGLVVEDVRTKLAGLFSRWYDLYDAVPVPHDNVLRPEEIALCIMMNSRMSGNTGLACQSASKTDPAPAGVPG